MPDFQPHNDLEERLVSAQEGRLDPGVLMEQLLESQLFMPVEDDDTGIRGFQKSSRAKPLTLDAEGTQVLVLFTSPERAKGFLADFPTCQGGLLTEFSWVLERVGSGVGIAINPGWEFGIDLDPATVEQLVHLNAARAGRGQTAS